MRLLRKVVIKGFGTLYRKFTFYQRIITPDNMVLNSASGNILFLNSASPSSSSSFHVTDIIQTYFFPSTNVREQLVYPFVSLSFVSLTTRQITYTRVTQKVYIENQYTWTLFEQQWIRIRAFSIIHSSTRRRIVHKCFPCGLTDVQSCTHNVYRI